MNLQDIFNSDLLTRINGVTVTDMIIGTVAAFIVGMFIFFIYRKTYKRITALCTRQISE